MMYVQGISTLMSWPYTGLCSRRVYGEFGPVAYDLFLLPCMLHHVPRKSCVPFLVACGHTGDNSQFTDCKVRILSS